MGRLVDIATVLAALSAVLIAGIVTARQFNLGPPAEGRSVGFVENWRGYTETSHRLGPDDARITIVEWGDYECPFCRSSAPHLSRAARRNPDLAVVYRHLPLPGHMVAYPAAIAAECAGNQGRFWEYHDLLYSNDSWQSNQGRGTGAFEELAVLAGVQDLPVFLACIEEEAPAERISQDIAAASELALRSTPSFLVNGEKFIGAMDSTRLAIILDGIGDGP
ncbi:MAG: thioredoxin domain-containing protein [Dehalococcoidia bacterium]